MVIYFAIVFEPYEYCEEKKLYKKMFLIIIFNVNRKSLEEISLKKCGLAI